MLLGGGYMREVYGTVANWRMVMVDGRGSYFTI